MAAGPREVHDGCERAVAELTEVLEPSASWGSRQDWAEAAAAAQRVIDVAAAVQDAAIVRLAAIEPEELEDGSVVESHRAPGHVALDAPAIVSGALSVSAVHAERRVRAAVRLAADGPSGSATETGLGGLHTAMRAGRLDAYRAGVLADELVEAPPQVAATVIGALEPHLGVEDAAHLRRRCRRVLARISPDLLVQRARRARSECGLRRWADEPGVDRWEGTFPSEEAAQAWAAIDALAQRYVAEDVCRTIDRARAKALTDLVAGSATIETVVTLTVPATLPDVGPTPGPSPEHPAHAAWESDPACAPRDASGDLVEVTGLSGSQPVLVSRQWVATTVHEQRGVDAGKVVTAACHPVTGALLDASSVPRAGEAARSSAADRLTAAAAAVGADRYRPSAGLVKRVRARDRRCRFPGCTVAAVFCDVDHVRPWPSGLTILVNLMCLCRRHHRIKQRPGWRVVLAADGVATWTDPTGRVRTTMPVDALDTVVLRGAGARPEPEVAAASTSRPRTAVPDGPHSVLEFRLEHLGAAAPRAATRWRDDKGRRHHTDVLARAGLQVLDRPGDWPHRPHRPPAGCRDATAPPF